MTLNYSESKQSSKWRIHSTDNIIYSPEGNSTIFGDFKKKGISVVDENRRLDG
jgi:hypothetical protein